MRVASWFLAASVIFAAAVAGTFGARFLWDRIVRMSPVLECPEAIDLGDRERGEIAIGHFRVKNGGRGELELDDFGTSCSCAGVERDVDGRLVRVKSIQLSAGDEVELTARVSVGAPLGQSQHVQAFFRANDLVRPLWVVDLIIPHVRDGCVAMPSAAVFGTLSPGERARKTIDVYDNGTGKNIIREVRCSHAERFRARLVPVPEEDKQPIPGAPGPLLARVEVTALAEAPGSLDGNIQISFANKGGKTDPIAVVGEVLGCARCWPSCVFLPRHRGDQLRYDDELLIVGRDEKPLQVRVASCPREISANLRTVPGQPDRWLLQVKWTPRGDEKATHSPIKSIRLRVASDGHDSELEVPIFLAEARS